MTQGTFKIFAFIFPVFLGFAFANAAIAQHSSILGVDTVVVDGFESDHFKIRLPTVSNIEAYKILFKNYGDFSEIEVEGKINQFVGDYKNIQRAKAIHAKIKKQGIENSVITYFKNPYKDVYESTVSQEAITGELHDKSISFSRKVLNITQKPEEDFVSVKDTFVVEATTFENILKTEKVAKKATNDADIANPASPKFKRPGVKIKAAIDKEKEEMVKELESDPFPSRPDKKAKDDVTKLEGFKPLEKLPEAGTYVILLPKVSNPEVYKIVLNDLGHVKILNYKDKANFYYFGFFDAVETAEAFVPKLNERGFNQTMRVVAVKNLDKQIQSIYELDTEEKAKVEKSVKKEKPITPATAKVDLSGEYFRIELPSVSNPEIFFKAFEDVGNTHSVIAPNGEAVYYIGVFENTDSAIEQLEALKPRGLTKGSIIRFEGEQRINPYRKDQLEQSIIVDADITKVEAEIKEPLMKTHPKGRFQVKMGLVDNPEVFKEVFGDIGKIKVGYLEDESEYFYLGNYYMQEDAEFVAKQLKQRGLTNLALVDIKSNDGNSNLLIDLSDNTGKTDAPEIVDESNVVENDSGKRDQEISVPEPEKVPVVEQPVIVEGEEKFGNTSVVEQPVNTLEKSGKVLVYKILLGALENPKLYENILKDFGTVSNKVENEETVYYLGDFNTPAVAKLIIEQIRKLGIESTLKIIEF